MSVSAEQIQNPENSAELGHAFAEQARDALYYTHTSSIPTAEGFKNITAWLENITLDDAGNCVSLSGELVIDAETLAEVKGYYNPANWLLGDSERTVLHRLEQEKRAKAHDKPTSLSLPAALAVPTSEILSDLSPADAETKIDSMRETAVEMLELDRAIRKDFADSAKAEAYDAITVRSEQIFKETYDEKFAKYSREADQTLGSGTDLAESQASLFGNAQKRALEAAQQAKENFIEDERVKALEPPELVAPSDEKVDRWKPGNAEKLEKLIEQRDALSKDGLLTVTSKQQLFDKVYKPANFRNNPSLKLPDHATSDEYVLNRRAGVLLTRFGETGVTPKTEHRPSLIKSVPKKMMRGGSNPVDYYYEPGKEAGRQAAIDKIDAAFDKLVEYRKQVLSEIEKLEGERDEAMFINISHKLLTALTKDRAHKPSEETVKRFVASLDPHSLSVLEFSIGGPFKGGDIEENVQLSRQRAEKILNSLLVAGVLGKSEDKQYRLLLPQNMAKDLIENASLDKPKQPEIATSTELSIEKLNEIRNHLTKIVRETLEYAANEKGEELSDTEVAEIIELERQNVLGEMIVKEFDINESDPTFNAAAAEGVVLLDKELKTLVANKAADLYAQAEKIVRLKVDEDKSKRPTKVKWDSAREDTWNEVIILLPVEEQSLTREVFERLKNESDKKREAERRRKEQLAERDKIKARTEQSVNENARRTAVEA